MVQMKRPMSLEGQDGLHQNECSSHNFDPKAKEVNLLCERGGGNLGF